MIDVDVLKSSNLSMGTKPNLINKPKSNLTYREHEVLVCLVKGFSRKEIARMLSISCHTTSDHIKNIYRKLEVHSKAQAVFSAITEGLIPIKLNH